ncbi:hypothetical protein [Lignipirellula cremea]|uniref:EF-hand domain-containing protein n=1 Tax=Lignipirellula cremea TaxID=2528010 RepID=A0A518DT93_9BACT|nr:hypothetical protein [Lignipirellula cremea]QDU95061.1 hypothetical protein Pla8534_28730 [Lignipirellula cremea]
MKWKLPLLLLMMLFLPCGLAFGEPSAERLAKWLKRFPAADANGDGLLTATEAAAYQLKQARSPADSGEFRMDLGAPPEPSINPGWDADRFPEHATVYRTPEEIADIYAKAIGQNRGAVVSHEKPADGSLRIVSTGHSFMGPGYATFYRVALAAGLTQPPLLTHTGGGMTGSARYKWEQENGIFQFDGKPTPKLMASIANAEWDAMLWGPYYHDRPAYYSCWIDFCLKYNPHMKFYLMDAWPQIDQLRKLPATEDGLSAQTIAQMGEDRQEMFGGVVDTLNKKYPGKVFVLPTCRAMVLAAEYYHRGELPGVEGIHTLVGGKKRTFWKDRIGHLGPGFDQLEGYLFYATLYGRSPELIEGDVNFGGAPDYPSRELDRVFRKIAWQAVLDHPQSGVVDKNSNGVDDGRE